MQKIMIVDDDPLIRQLLSYQLAGAGYHVCTVQNGTDALERLILDEPDLVLLDVVMPGISGWDVCNQIRTCSSVPVIMLTAKNADRDVVTGLVSGADDYIAKPFSQAQLLARIEAVLRRSHYATTLHANTTKSPSPIIKGDLYIRDKKHSYGVSDTLTQAITPKPSKLHPQSHQSFSSALWPIYLVMLITVVLVVIIVLAMPPF